MELNANLVSQTLAYATQHGTAARKINTVLKDIGIQFRRSILQSIKYSRFNLGNGTVQTVCNLLIAYGDRHWQGGYLVGAVNDVILRGVLGKLGQSGTNVDLDALGHTFTHLDIMLTAHVLLDIGRKIITGNLNGVV